MRRDPNHIYFDIPIPIVILSYFFNPAIGIVLTVLRAISIPKGGGGENRSKGGASFEERLERKMYETEKSFEERVRRMEKRAEKERSAASAGPETTRERDTRKKSRGKKAKRTGHSAAVAFCNIACVFFAVISLIGFSDGVEESLWCLLLSGGSALLSHVLRTRNVRYGRLRAMIGEKESVSLIKLASASKSTVKKVSRDLQRLIDKGEFGDEAYLDLGAQTFMRYPDAAPDVVEGFDYRSVYDKEIFGRGEKEKERVRNEQTESVEKEKKEAEGEPSAPLSDKDNFRSIILEIRRLNDEIRDFAVSERIYRIEEHTQHIFDYVLDHPESMPQIRTFMNYYLPTTLKLLESYSRIERVGIAGENMKQSKEKIENILDLLVVGFEQQVDQLFKNESIDISSDIRVLETMMQRDGLSGKSDFQINLESGGKMPWEKSAANGPGGKDNANEAIGSTDVSFGTAGGAAAQFAPEEMEKPDGRDLEAKQ